MDIANPNYIGGCLRPQCAVNLVCVLEHTISIIAIVTFISLSIETSWFIILGIIPFLINFAATIRFGSSAYLQDARRTKYYQIWKIVHPIIAVITISTFLWFHGTGSLKHTQKGRIDGIRQRNHVFPAIALFNALYALLEIYFLIIAYQLQTFWSRLRRSGDINPQPASNENVLPPIFGIRVPDVSYSLPMDMSASRTQPELPVTDHMGV